MTLYHSLQLLESFEYDLISYLVICLSTLFPHHPVISNDTGQSFIGFIEVIVMSAFNFRSVAWSEIKTLLSPERAKGAMEVRKIIKEAMGK